MRRGYKRPSRLKLLRDRRLIAEDRAIATWERMMRLNPGLAEMRAEEAAAIMKAYIQDLEAGRNPAPPFKGLLESL